jgi:ectoine hydroxylase-related dioxygenase (phytanoyl-CoA dioxygenase family)
LLGEEAVLFKDKINFKMPGGDGFKPHQDSQAGWEVYARYFINVMVCIDEATIENGCLELASRPNQIRKKELIGKEWVPLSKREVDLIDFKPYPTKPGDIIYFDSYAPHRSARNSTENQRRLYFSTYNRLSEGNHLEAYYKDKRETFPPDIERKSDRSYIYRV